MAKKSSKKKQSDKQPVSPLVFLRDKARSLPLGKCYINDYKDAAGLAVVLVSRLHPNGNVTWALYEVDMYCLGVKDAFVHVNEPPTRFQKRLDELNGSFGLVETGYDVCHNMIYGAVEFAREAGINPVAEFSSARYLLEEDIDDIPLIEYEYGLDGRHHLVIHPEGDEKPYLAMLEKNLGKGNYTVVDNSETAVKVLSRKLYTGYNDMMAEINRHPSEPYSYKHPAYHVYKRFSFPEIKSILLDPANIDFLPDETIDMILSHPADKLVVDVNRLITNEIGRTWAAIEDDTIEPYTNASILYGVMFLTELKRPEGLPVIMEILRQSDDFLQYHFGDISAELLIPAVYACGRNDIPVLLDFLETPGFNSYARHYVHEALGMIAINEPERRGEIIGVFRRILTDMVTSLPKVDRCDGMLAGLMMSTLISINACELLPEIKAVFETDCVDLSAAGDYDAIKSELTPDCRISAECRHDLRDIHAVNKWLKTFVSAIDIER
ncbi:MAG: DUF1186 family protein [Duncaniella sp.]|nr:DUF1186 family protein [Duncaniella sp.]